MLNVGLIITRILLLLRYGKVNGSEDPETIAIEKIVCYTHRAQKKGTGHTMVGDTRKHHGQSEAEGVMENVDKSLYCGFHRAGRVSRLASLKHCSGF